MRAPVPGNVTMQRRRGGAANLHGERAGQGRDDHEGQGGDGIDADDQLDAVEGAAERGIEGAADGRRRAAAHQHPQIIAAQPETAPEPGGDARAELGIARLHARPRRRRRWTRPSAPRR